MKVNSFTAKPHSAKKTGSKSSHHALQWQMNVPAILFTLGWYSMDIRGFFVPSGSHFHSANSSNSKRKGNDEGDALQSSGSSGKRNFVRSWTKDFPWLEYDGEKMWCKPCCSRTTESDSSSVFVTGSTNFKIEWIWSHEKSNGHNRAVAAIKVAENPRLAPLPQLLWTVSKDVAQKMERLFNIAYFVAKREMPFTSFHIFAIIHLEMKHGVDLRKYIHNWQLKNELLCKRQKCRFVSVMADSATDVGVREIEDVFVSTERSTGTLHRVW